MKNLSPNWLILYSSFLLSIIQVIVLFAVSSALAYVSFKVSIISGVFMFVTTYIILRFVIFKIIYAKVSLIYKKIQNEVVEDYEHLKSKKHNSDIFTAVDKDVNQWLETQEQEIADLKKMAQYRKEFLGNVSHELKTPIFSIQGYILTLLDGAMEDEEITKKYLTKAAKNIDRMTQIVQDLEEISKLEHGQKKMEKERFNVIELTRDVFDSLEEKANERKIELKLSGSPTFVIGDKNSIRHVLSNLILNGINYGVENGYVLVQVFNMDENILIEVSDNGIGIDKEHLPRLFERFYRVDKSRSTKFGGTGLGLSIVKHIIEAQGQTINVRSTKGVGTTFAFTLKSA